MLIPKLQPNNTNISRSSENDDLKKYFESSLFITGALD